MGGQHFLNRKRLLINGDARMSGRSTTAAGELRISTGGALFGTLYNQQFSTTIISLEGVFAGGLDNAGDITVDSGSTLASGVSGEPMNNTGTISILNGSRLGVSHGASLLMPAAARSRSALAAPSTSRVPEDFATSWAYWGVNGRVESNGLFINDDSVTISGIDGEGHRHPRGAGLQQRHHHRE
jgi:hypothetical protein